MESRRDDTLGLENPKILSSFQPHTLCFLLPRSITPNFFFFTETMHRRQRLRPMRGAPHNLGHRSVQEQSNPVHSIHFVVSASSSSPDSSRHSPSSSKRTRRSTSASSNDSMSSGELVLENLSNEVNSMHEKNVVRLDKLLRKIQDSSSRPSTSSTICRSCKRARHSKDSSSRPRTFYEAADAALPPKGKGKSPAIEVEDSEFEFGNLA